jgi:protein arginine N-methyltransferase 1
MGEYPAYDDRVYDAFDAADDRHRAYRAAVRAAAPGRVVVDIGTGRDALWAIEAAHAGARHVYAIEADETTADRAAAAVIAAGLDDRVTVLPGLSSETTLPVRAEVCVSEIVGNIASAEGTIAVLADARARLCVPDCVWIPFRVQTWAAAVDLTGTDPALAAGTIPYLHRVFEAAGAPFDLRLCLGGPATDVIISSAVPVESIVFSADRPPPARDDRTAADLRIGAATATMTGVLLWTRVAAESRGGREVDTLDGGTRAWAPVYAPLPEPLPVTGGQHIPIALTRRTSDDGLHPDYDLTVDDRPAWSSPHHGGPFRATPFYRTLFPAPSGLGHQPVLPGPGRDLGTVP